MVGDPSTMSHSLSTPTLSHAGKAACQTVTHPGNNIHTSQMLPTIFTLSWTLYAESVVNICKRGLDLVLNAPFAVDRAKRINLPNSTLFFQSTLSYSPELRKQAI